MSQTWKRRRWGIVQPTCEALEDRVVPAGGIVAFVNNGILTIRSINDEASAFIVSGAGERSVVIRPLAGTSINGANEAIWVGDIKRGFDIQTGNGDDTVIISNVKCRDFLSIVTNGGNDVVHVVHGTKSPHSTWIRTGDGDDLIFVDGTTHRKHFAIDAGNGNDTVTITDSRFGKQTFFQGGAGNNKLIQSGNDFRRLPAVANFESSGKVQSPVAVNDSASVAASGSVTINVLANDQPGEGTLVPSTVTITSPATSGFAQVNADGTIKYTNFNASAKTDSFRYTVANSAGGVSNEATVTITITDTTAPTVTLSTTVSDPTNTSPMPFTATFSQDVSGLTLSDITVTNGTASGLTAVNGKVYNFNVTPVGEGTVTVAIPAGAAQNAQGTASQASNIITRVFDTTAPTVTINSLTTNNTTPTITGTVNDASAKIVVTVNGQVANGLVTGSTWSASLTTPLADGTYSIAVTATDKAGNVGSANLANGLVIDTVSPTVLISSSAPDPTNKSPVPITVTFSEVVTGFVLSDIQITGGTGSNFTTTDQKVYNFDLTPSGPGVIRVNVPAGVTQDAAGNINIAAPEFQFTFQEDANLTATLSTTASNPTRFSPIPVTATFNQVVFGFVVADLKVTNATVSNFSTVNNKTFTFDLIPSDQGEVTVQIPANVAVNEEGLSNLESNKLAIVFDSVAPTTTINALITNNPTPTITGTVSEFGASVEVSANAVIVQAVVTGKNWSATFTQPFKDGTYNVTAVAKDAAGNQSPNLLPGGLVIDTVDPVLFLSTTLTSPTNADTIPVQVTVSEPVTGVSLSSFAVVNGTASNLQIIDDQNFTFEITPTGDGQVRVSLEGFTIFDLAGNPAVLDAALVIVSDRTAPVVTISTTADDPTNLDEIPFTIAINEATSALNQASISVTNGSIANFAQNDDKTYSFVVLPVSDGPVVLTVAAGSVTDLAGNANKLTTFTIESARGIPGVTLSYAGSSPTNVAVLPFTASFSLSVTGFEAADITVANGTVQNFVEVDDKNYTFEIVPAAEGPVIVLIPADVAQSEQGKFNTQSNSIEVVYDITSPTGSIASTASNPTNADPIPMTITFSEPVASLAVGMFTVVNGTVQNLSQVGDAKYTFDVVPLADGAVTVSIAAGATTDLAGNPIEAVAEFTIVSDRTRPSVTITTTAVSPTNVAPLPFTVEFSEDVFGFDENGVTVSNGVIANFLAVDGKTYTFEINPLADGPVSVAIAAGVAVDAANNPNLAAPEVIIVFDSASPTVAVSSSSPSPTNANSFSVTIEFSEDVGPLAEGDVLILNGTISNFTSLDAKTYTFDVEPLADGDVTISLPAGVVADLAGNPNLASNLLTIISDRTAPSVTITTSLASPTNADFIPVTITFTEDVAGFSAAGISVTNGTIVNFVEVNPTTYTFEVEPLADGDVIISVAAGVATDAAGNPNDAAVDLTIVSDRTRPGVMISTPVTSPTNLDAIPLTITFTEDVTGFSAAGISVTNGTIVNFVAVNGMTYTFEVEPLADGDVIVSVAAGVATDAAGNPNDAAMDLTIVSDRTSPVPTLSSTVSSPTNAGSVSFTVTFDEAVTGFSLAGINVSNGLAVNFMMLDAFTYTFEVEPLADGDVTVTVVAGSATDAAGNANAASSPFTFVSDRTAPSGSVDAAGTGVITGTASDAIGPIQSVQISIFNGSNYWDGTGFNSPVEIFFTVDTLDNFANWSYSISETGTFEVSALITDAAGNTTTINQSVTVS